MLHLLLILAVPIFLAPYWSVRTIRTLIDREVEDGDFRNRFLVLLATAELVFAIALNVASAPFVALVLPPKSWPWINSLSVAFTVALWPLLHLRLKDARSRAWLLGGFMPLLLNLQLVIILARHCSQTFEPAFYAEKLDGQLLGSALLGAIPYWIALGIYRVIRSERRRPLIDPILLLCAVPLLVVAIVPVTTVAIADVVFLEPSLRLILGLLSALAFALWWKLHRRVHDPVFRRWIVHALMPAIAFGLLITTARARTAGFEEVDRRQLLRSTAESPQRFLRTQRWTGARRRSQAQIQESEERVRNFDETIKRTLPAGDAEGFMREYEALPLSFEELYNVEKEALGGPLID